MLIEITERAGRERNKARRYRRDDSYKGELYIYDYIQKKWNKADEKGELQEIEDKEKCISTVLNGFDLKDLDTSYKIIKGGVWVTVK